MKRREWLVLSVILGLPLQALSVEKFDLPAALGRLEDVHYGAASPVVVCVADATPDHEGQRQLAQLIQYWHNHKTVGPIRWIATQDRGSSFQVSRFALSQDKGLEKVKTAEGANVSAFDDYAMVSSSSDMLWGLEDPRRYEVHLQMLRKATDEQTLLSGELEDLKEGMISTKDKRLLHRLAYHLISKKDLALLNDRLPHILKRVQNVSPERASTLETAVAQAQQSLEASRPDDALLLKTLEGRTGTVLVIANPFYAEELALHLKEKNFSYVLIGQPSFELSQAN